MGQVVLNHPKMVNKWATRYIAMYRKQGSDVARSWAMEFLPPNPRQAMIEEVNKLLGKNNKKQKAPEEGPDGDGDKAS